MGGTPSYIQAKRETDILGIDKYYDQLGVRGTNLEELNLLN